MTDFPAVKFPAAYYGCGKAYVQLHRHSDAIAVVKLGVELLPSYIPSRPLYWPATNQAIPEWKPDVIEVSAEWGLGCWCTLPSSLPLRPLQGKLLQLLQQCEPMSVPDAICRYSACLGHNSSCNIWLSHLGTHRRPQPGPTLLPLPLPHPLLQTTRATQQWSAARAAALPTTPPAGDATRQTVSRTVTRSSCALPARLPTALESSG